jgi:hypothetical protein
MASQEIKDVIEERRVANRAREAGNQADRQRDRETEKEKPTVNASILSSDRRTAIWRVMMAAMVVAVGM